MSMHNTQDTQDSIKAMVIRAAIDKQAKLASELPQRRRTSMGAGGLMDLSVSVRTVTDKKAVIAKVREVVLNAYKKHGIDYLTPVMGRLGFNVTAQTAYTPLYCVPMSTNTSHGFTMDSIIVLDFSPFQCRGALDSGLIALPSERNKLAMIVPTSSKVTSDLAAWQSMQTLTEEEGIVVHYDKDTRRVLVMSKVVDLSDDMRTVLTSGTPDIYLNKLEAEGVVLEDPRDLPPETICGRAKLSMFISSKPLNLDDKVTVLLPKIIA